VKDAYSNGARGVGRGTRKMGGRGPRRSRNLSANREVGKSASRKGNGQRTKFSPNLFGEWQQWHL